MTYGIEVMFPPEDPGIKPPQRDYAIPPGMQVHWLAALSGLFSPVAMRLNNIFRPPRFIVTPGMEAMAVAFNRNLFNPEADIAAQYEATRPQREKWIRELAINELRHTRFTGWCIQPEPKWIHQESD